MRSVVLSHFCKGLIKNSRDWFGTYTHKQSKNRQIILKSFQHRYCGYKCLGIPFFGNHLSIYSFIVFRLITSVSFWQSMGITTSVERVLHKWNAASDEYSDLVMQREYRNFVHIIGLYPNVNKVGYSWSFFRIILIGASLLCHSIGLVVSTIFLYDINFIYFSSALHYVFVVGISFFYNFHFNRNRAFLARYHSRMYFNFYDYHEETTDEIRELVKATEVQKKRFMILPMFSACAAVCILLLAPILDKYGTFDFDIETSINFNLPLPMVYIFDSSTVAGYMTALTHQLLSAMLCGLIFGGCGYMYIVMVSSLSLQMRILIHRLDTIEGRALSLYEANYGSKPKFNDYDLYKDRRFSKCMDVCLKRCVEHHKVILR